jgi:hypothetical protein
MGGGVSYTGGGIIYGQHLVLVLNFIVPVNYIVNSLNQNMLMTVGFTAVAILYNIIIQLHISFIQIYFTRQTEYN